MPRAFSTSVSAIDKAVVRRQVKILRITVVIFAEIVISFAFIARPTKLYKLRLVVRNCDFLVGHGISRYRANRLAASFFKSIVFTFFVKGSGNAVQRCPTCIFEVKRHTRVIVFHARPLGFVVRVVYDVKSSVIKLRGCSIKYFSGNLINRCPVLIVFIFSAEGEELTFPSITVLSITVLMILENKPIKTAARIVRLT